jgi:nitrite reductase/ring-hydroxylating ferredoxin subunit
MAEKLVGKASEFKDGDRRIVFVGDTEIGVFKDRGEFHTETHFVCPWHGYEYDIKTGECVSDRKLKLRRYKVVQKGDDVYVVA